MFTGVSSRDPREICIDYIIMYLIDTNLNNFLSELKTASHPKTRKPIRATDYITVLLSSESPSKANSEASVKILLKKWYGDELRG